MRYAGVELRGPDAPPPGQLDLSGTGADAAGEAARRAAAVARLVEPLSAALAARGMSRLYDEVERPLVRVLARMEDAGVRVDVDRAARAWPTSWPSEARRLEEEIQDLAGDAVRRQLHPAAARDPLRQAGPHAAEADQDRATRPTPRRSRSCAASTRSSTPCCATGRSRSCGPPTASRCWPRWRRTGASTPPSTRPSPAPAGSAPISPTCTTSRSAARRAGASGRASCPAEGCRFLVADYNQIELRVIAHLAEDPGLIEAFQTGTDIHNVTAARIYGVDAGRRDHRHAVEGQDGVLRAGLRDGVLRAGPAPGDPGRRRRPRSSRPTSRGSPTCGPTWTGW